MQDLCLTIMQINVDLIYPIGSIYMTTSTVSPAVLFGGTWERIKGRCIVGVDENDTDFATARKTGGEKTHQLTANEMPAVGMIPYDSGKTTSEWCIGEIKQYSAGTYKITRINIGKGAHNNLQPYYTAYIWRRVS